MEARYEQGVRTMRTIVGDYALALEAKLDGVAPGFPRALIAYAFGDICSRPGLDLKMREMATVAALTAMGTAGPQLAVHIGGALNAGCSQEEVAEVIVQMSVYAGIPAALNALGTAKGVFEARKAGG